MEQATDGRPAGSMGVEMLPGGAEAHADSPRRSEQPASASQPTPRHPAHLMSDGTWMSRDEVKTIDNDGLTKPKGREFFTNVSLLSQALLPYSTKPNDQDVHERQISLYQKGIGAGKGWINAFRRYVQGATGQGIGANVLEAYNFIVDNYQPGDSVSAFGFSRGAYTARTLVALLNWAGVMSKVQAAKVSGRLWRKYQQRDPSQPRSILAASQFLYDSTGRWPSRNAEGTEIRLMRAAAELDGRTLSSEVEAWISDAPTRDSQGRAETPIVRVVGVFDTVGSLGVPGLYLPPDEVSFYSFFDPILSPNVQHAFHAMSLFEARHSFQITPWYVPAPGVEDDRDAEMREGQVLKQCWFKGSHSDVGGGKACRGLSDISLAWMVAQLAEARGGPLIAIDEQVIASARDMSKAWATQRQQRVPWFLPIRVPRQPLHQPRKETWSNAVDLAKTGEELHHSVTVGGDYSIGAKQFAELRKRSSAELQRIWQQAQDSSRLLLAERRLKWN